MRKTDFGASMEEKLTHIINERIPTTLSTSDFFYELPEELIAQSPSPERDGCRLMVLDRGKDHVEHRVFHDIIDYLNPEDMLVVNSSKVIPARLLGTEVNRGGSMELLLLRMLESGEWETLVRPGKRAKLGAEFSFSDILRATVTEVMEDGNRKVKFTYNTEKYKNIYEVLDAVGNMPLPPYITKKLENKDDYQTVYAKEEGSAAAPTAGLQGRRLRRGHASCRARNLPPRQGGEDRRSSHARRVFLRYRGGRLGDQPPPRGGGKDRRGRNDLLPRARERVGRAGYRPPDARRDKHLHLSRLPLQGDRRPDYQLPPTREHSHHVGQCPCGKG